MALNVSMIQKFGRHLGAKGISNGRADWLVLNQSPYKQLMALLEAFEHSFEVMAFHL